MHAEGAGVIYIAPAGKERTAIQKFFVLFFKVKRRNIFARIVLVLHSIVFRGCADEGRGRGCLLPPVYQVDYTTAYFYTFNILREYNYLSKVTWYVVYTYNTSSALGPLLTPRCNCQLASFLFETRNSKNKILTLRVRTRT